MVNLWLNVRAAGCACSANPAGTNIRSMRWPQIWTRKPRPFWNSTPPLFTTELPVLYPGFAQRLCYYELIRAGPQPGKSARMNCSCRVSPGAISMKPFDIRQFCRLLPEFPPHLIFLGCKPRPHGRSGSLQKNITRIRVKINDPVSVPPVFSLMISIDSKVRNSLTKATILGPAAKFSVRTW